MVSHRNLINFFAGMDARIARDPPGVWLAVTSLSFDISVLELLWTLTRGFKTVLHGEPDWRPGPAAGEASGKPIEFSLFYFASDEDEFASKEDEAVGGKYRLLLEGAKFADRAGFSAVWSPERHFHGFGGLYPNPSVVGAAIATVTKRVAIRAGSCVLPLHNPIRVAEEWALVDNLSNGRVGISFASGWQPNDFVLAPEKFPDRKAGMFRDIDTVKRLWRGETVSFPGPTGGDVAIRTHPRPVQKQLPVWVTAAGNPETFQQAGEMGTNLLTHLLGQSVEQLAEKIAVYRDAWRAHGHQGEGHVTLMLHTFVGEDRDALRDTVRRPMKQYLQSSIDLIRGAAWTFPPFLRRAAATGKSPTEIFDSKDLSAEDTEALLDHAFERYFETSGLFGTPDTCLKIVDKLRAAGVDELACLIDFGVETDAVLESLERLRMVMERATAVPEEARATIAGQIRAHGVTHLQCTPSLARMLISDPKNHAAIGSLRVLMVGGEAFPPALAQQLCALGPAEVLNMYGPTETTIWSMTHRVSAGEQPVPLGRPIANTRVYVLDADLHPVPPEVPGELFIGGEGVALGYLDRPELTAERFIPDPFDGAAGARLYRTGDQVRYRPDGTFEFLGRLDHQVKIRGHRIELGEIEALLIRQPGIREALVVAREDERGDKHLVAYLVAQPGASVNYDWQRALAALPDYMVPVYFMTLDSLPLTANGKVDRARLPAPGVATGPDGAGPAPQDALEATIARVWQDVLNLPSLGREADFFRSGGDSLLAIVAHRKLCDALGRELPVTDVFRCTTIVGLAQQIRTTQRDGAIPAVNAISGVSRRAYRLS
jgi:natural product biosynthesis luciferase-like monooxygenase protein